MNTASALAILLQPIPLIAGWAFILAGGHTAGVILLAVSTAAALFVTVAAWRDIARQIREHQQARERAEEIAEFQRRINDTLDRMTRAAEDA